MRTEEDLILASQALIAINNADESDPLTHAGALLELQNMLHIKGIHEMMKQYLIAKAKAARKGRK